VTKKARALIEQGLLNSGYRVTDDPHASNSVAVSVNEFWAWFTPGFVAVTFEAKLSCQLNVHSADGSTHTAVIKAYGKNVGQAGTNGNWRDTYTLAFTDFEKNFGSSVDQLGLK
jgi:uncharacterized lipoprotein YajG